MWHVLYHVAYHMLETLGEQTTKDETPLERRLDPNIVWMTSESYARRFRFTIGNVRTIS